MQVDCHTTFIQKAVDLLCVFFERLFFGSDKDDNWRMFSGLATVS